VSAVTVDVETKTVHIDGDVTDIALRAAIDEAGYDAAGVTA
jgi:copper chaperone CopZ